MLIVTDLSRNIILQYVRYDPNIPILNRSLVPTHILFRDLVLKICQSAVYFSDYFPSSFKYPLDYKDFFSMSQQRYSEHFILSE